MRRAGKSPERSSSFSDMGEKPGHIVNNSAIRSNCCPIGVSEPRQLEPFFRISDFVPKSDADARSDLSQMTIFYRGVVLVLDDVSSEKAEKIMKAAQKVSLAHEKLGEPAINIGPSSDLPIARRASLRRFLEKRRDRHVQTTKAPYDMNKPSPSSRSDDL